MTRTTSISLTEARRKIETYCAYQERCHQEVSEKLRGLGLKSAEIDELIACLIDQNFLNEERFARSFARGKHRIKNWGRERIVMELRRRNISPFNIKSALEEIPDVDYADSFQALSVRHWNSITETNPMKKRKKFCDFLLRRGFESEMVYAKLRDLENGSA